MLFRFREIMIFIHNGISFLPFLFRSRRCRTWCICMFAFPPHTSHVSLRSLSTISDLILTYGSMTRSSMTGFLRRLSDNPPNVATRGFFFGLFQTPVDSFNTTSGGGRMIQSLNRYDSSPSTHNQRPRHEVYQTPRFRSRHPYRDCQAGLAPSRRLRQNDPNCTVLSHLQDLSLSTAGCRPPPVAHPL